MLGKCLSCGQEITPHDFRLGVRESYHYECWMRHQHDLQKQESGIRWWQPVLGAAVVVCVLGLLAHSCLPT